MYLNLKLTLVNLLFTHNTTIMPISCVPSQKELLRHIKIKLNKYLNSDQYKNGNMTLIKCICDITHDTDFFRLFFLYNSVF